MIKTLALVLFLLLVSVVQGQHFTLSLLRNPHGTAYLGIDNPISCTIESLSSKKVVLSVDNGSIHEIDGFFIFRPSSIGPTSIAISKREKGKIKKVGDFSLVVKDLPLPVAQVGGVYEQCITKGFIKAQQGIGAHQIGPPYICMTYSVVSFTTMVRRNKEMIFYNYNEGNTFRTETIDFFNHLQKDDVILFSSIKIEYMEGKLMIVKPLEYVITDLPIN